MSLKHVTGRTSDNYLQDVSFGAGDGARDNLVNSYLESGAPNAQLQSETTILSPHSEESGLKRQNSEIVMQKVFED
eukprot:CAMPEP_0170473244 /NCGR_PEP_ID=MMETSP0123-20130129/15174_1 /TAXON_ID=182087 /ORGANISM="Favella ehrenbergii, Strain Fehren 1" /LENGTH=75 /DNA_ID=CAMNT_0010742119 /DNA_START=961 /DNA_END=1188 /DNA_ORIENTATION=+